MMILLLTNFSYQYQPLSEMKLFACLSVCGFDRCSVCPFICLSFLCLLKFVRVHISYKNGMQLLMDVTF